MKRVSIIGIMTITVCAANAGAIGAAGAGAGAGSAADRPLHPGEAGGRIVLIGARWCGPCMAEYRELPALVVAARPERIVLAWIDRPLPPPAALAGEVGVMLPAEARRLALLRLGEGFGLPAVVFTGAALADCPPLRGRLTVQSLAALLRLCGKVGAP